MPAITISLDKGCSTGIDPTLLKQGQLQEAEGVAYGVSDPAVSKIGGRTAFNSAAPTSASVNGINFNSFDTGTDYVTAQVGGTLYSAPSSTGVFTSIRTGLTASAELIDRTKFADAAYMCNSVDANWVHKNNNTTFVWGLNPQTVAPTGALGGTGITGTYVYWTTEYDSVNDVESASGTSAASPAILTIVPANQTVTITKPATINASATHWRVYRTIASGLYPTGWRVATVLIGTSTYADSTSDAALVLPNQPYDTVAPNDVPEPRNYPPPVFRSICTFEGSLCGVYARSLAFSETGTPHYFPQTYVVNFRPTFGGQARCVRTVDEFALVFFDHDTFRVNTLPKAADSFFDTGVVQKHIADYGTPSPLGACRFSGWGGIEMVFFWDRSGPMITDGKVFDRAVDNIDSTMVPAANLATVECHDNPYRFRVEVTYLDSASKYRRLDFYYDSMRVTQERGFPELAWTGPHLVPGPGTYGVLNGVGVVWTGSRAGDGKVYQEDSGYSDAAQLVDSAGTVNFRMRTPRLYANGINSQATIGRIFVSKRGTSTGTYGVVLNTWNEGDVNQPVATSHPIDATVTGATSDDFTRAGQSFDMRVTRDDAVFMPPINNITLVPTSVGEYAKTNRR